MKLLSMMIILTFTFTAHARKMELSYKDHVKVSKVVMLKKLPTNLQTIFKDFHFEPRALASDKNN